ncbi:MAG: MFS transporter [Candidatus Melainabacteria bacterium]|nr:MFS transporter [Candidatus Melainabacteria bacterium]
MIDANLDNERLALRILMVSGALTCLAGLNCGWFGPLVASIASAQKMHLVEAGSLISVYSAGSLIPLAIGRQLVERFGGRKCLLAAALLFCGGLAIMSFGSHIIGLSIGAAALGVGAGLNSIAGTICILRLASGSSAAAVGKLNVFFGIGALLGPVIALMGLNSPFSYHAVYVFGAIFALVVFLAAFFSQQLDVRVPAPDSHSSDFHPMQTPALMYTAAVFLYVGIEVAVATWLFTYLNMTCLLSKDLAGWSMTALWAGLTTGRMLAVYLFRYYPADRIAFSCMVLVLSGILCLALLPHLGAAALMVVCVLGMGLGPIFPTLISSASERYGENSASVTSLVVTAGAFAGITFPLIIGQVFSRAGHQQGMLVLALSASILSVVFFIVQFRMALPAHKLDM